MHYATNFARHPGIKQLLLDRIHKQVEKLLSIGSKSSYLKVAPAALSRLCTALQMLACFLTAEGPSTNVPIISILPGFRLGPSVQVQGYVL